PIHDLVRWVIAGELNLLARYAQFHWRTTIAKRQNHSSRRVGGWLRLASVFSLENKIVTIIGAFDCYASFAFIDGYSSIGHRLQPRGENRFALIARAFGGDRAARFHFSGTKEDVFLLGIGVNRGEHLVLLDADVF